MSYTIVVNGVSHSVSHVDGRAVYDPPLDKAFERQSDARLRDMLRSQSAPRCMTDREFFQGIGTLDKQFADDEEGLREVVRIARSHGYNPGAHDVYMDNLAQFPGDPEAFVTPSGGRGQIKRVCEKRGVSCHGAVEVKAVAPTRDHVKSPKCLLADDIVDDEIKRRVKKDPSLAKKSRAELREQVIDKHALKL